MLSPVLREMDDVTAKSLSIISERSWQLEDVAKTWEKGNVTPVFKKDNKKDPGKYGLVSLNSVHGMVLEQVTLKTISKHIKDKKVINTSQHGFKKEKSCLTTW